MSSTAVPPGNCVTHGYHGRVACPRCSTSAIPPAPLGQAVEIVTDLGLDPAEVVYAHGCLTTREALSRV